MIQSMESKELVTIVGTGITNGATGTAQIDCIGYDYAEVTLIMGTSDTPSDKPSVCKLAESDDTQTTNFNDIAAFKAGTSAGNWTMPNADSTNPNIYKFCVDRRARKRYLKLSVSPVTTQLVIVHTKLSRAKDTPTTASQEGVLALVTG